MEVKRMEAKDTKQQTPSVTETRVKRKSWFDYAEDIKTEFKQINWTSKEELKNYTQITVVATFLFGMLIYIADLAIQVALGLLTYIVRLIAG